MHHDLIIIGAGIHGAAVARAAAADGYRVTILEQYPEAALGTSSKSSKLIHGGLRYLETAQIKLVRECLKERRHLLEQRPDLVSLSPFFIPVYRHTGRSPWLIAAGLGLYALLGGKGFRLLSKSEWQTLDGLRTRDLRAVFRYWDARTDDKLLTEQILSEAVSMGTEVHYNATFQNARCDTDSCSVTFANDGKQHNLTGHALINAAGPWVNHVLKAVTPVIDPLDADLVQGTHIVVPGTLERGVYYLEAPQDQRALFAIPWKGGIMIGTTETIHRGEPEQAHPLESEITYLLETWNHHFENQLKHEDVIESFAGLRVLPASEGSAFSRSRDTRIHQDRSNRRVLSIYGGKLTSHRKTASEVLKRLNDIICR
jgi:glycerol-3-phosphate dehydrogenase